MAKKRALETYMGGIRERVVRRDAQVAAPRLRALKARFLQVTAGTRARIKAMENNVNPKARTERALAARRAIMVRYEAAYAEQGRMVASGVVPEDIMEYM